MTTTQYVIALDVGGSSVKSGIVSTDQTVMAVSHTPINSKGDAAHILSTLTGIIQQHLAQIPEQRLLGIGFGFPSPFDYDAGVCLIKGVQKYERIYGVNVREALRERLNRPDMHINFRNDAEAAIIAETRYGAAKQYRRVIGLTLGTGLGSAFVVNNVRIKQGAHVPAPDGMLFHEIYRGQQADEWFSTRGVLARIEARALPYESVAAACNAADEGSEAAQALFAEWGDDLGTFIAPYMRNFNAEALLIVGGIAGAFSHFHDAIQAHTRIPILRGTLGQDGALLGAAEPLLATNLTGN